MAIKIGVVMIDAGSDFSKAEKHKGITFTRIPDMPYVAVVEDLSDMALWRNRKNLDLRGLITTMPLSEDERIGAIKSLTTDQESLSKDLEISGVNMHQSVERIGRQALKNRFTPFSNPKYELEPDKNGVRFSDDVQNISNVLINTFLNTARASLFYVDISVSGRVNCVYPAEPHTHMPSPSISRPNDTMTLALSQSGTVIYSDDSFDSDGQLITDKDDEQIISHTMEQGQLILMDDTLWHSAASYDESWEETPRVNLLIG